MHDKGDMQLHKKSHEKFPKLDLAQDEYVVVDVERHWMGRLKVWVGIVLGVIVLLAAAAFFLYADFGKVDFSDYLAIACVVIAISMPFIGTIFIRDYDEDWFVVTNLRLINSIRHTAFATVNQEVSLSNVEDISFSQLTILERMFNYGTIKMSTIGDEHTYRFTYVSNPADQIKVISRTVNDHHKRHSDDVKKSH